MQAERGLKHRITVGQTDRRYTQNHSYTIHTHTYIVWNGGSNGQTETALQARLPYRPYSKAVVCIFVQPLSRSYLPLRMSWLHVLCPTFGVVTPAHLCFSQASDVCFNPFQFHFSPVPSCGLPPYHSSALQATSHYHKNNTTGSRSPRQARHEERCGSR